MSMLKKTAALTVSAVLLLQPMTASAVTWSNIVDGLRNSGSNRYTEDGTTIDKDGDNYTVTGGTIDEYGWVDEGYFGKNGNVTLNDLVIDGHLHIFSEDGSVISVVIGEGTLIKGNINAHANGAGNSLTITNNGKVDYAGVNSKDGGYVYIVNNGNINQITGRMLDDVTIPLPPMALVDQFAAFVEQTDKSKVAVQKALDEAQLLFDSLMQKYFG